MNKSDLCSVLATKAGLTHAAAEEIVNTIFDSMADTLAAGDRIEIRGFGSFVVKSYDGYTGRNPKTGEEVQIKPKKAPFFKAGKALKENIAD